MSTFRQSCCNSGRIPARKVSTESVEAAVFGARAVAAVEAAVFVVRAAAAFLVAPVFVARVVRVGGAGEADLLGGAFAGIAVLSLLGQCSATDLALDVEQARP
jgi:hypothetical protein